MNLPTIDQAIDCGLYEQLWQAAADGDRRQCHCVNDVCAMCEEIGTSIEAVLGYDVAVYVSKAAERRMRDVLEERLEGLQLVKPGP